MSHAATLAAAEDAVLHGDAARAIELLLPLWRDTWNPGVAELIERLAPETVRPLEGLPALQGMRAEALAALSGASTDVDRSSALAELESFARIAIGSNVSSVAQAWVTVPPDPRVARTALTLLSKSGATRELTSRLWRLLAASVEQHGHAGLKPELEVLARASGPRAATRVRKVLELLALVRAPLPVDAPELVGRLLARVPAPSTAPPPLDPGGLTPAQFLRAIIERPEDDGPRLTFADWLSERGDPRGEFIVLQVKRANGKLTREERAREAELLRRHRFDFLGAMREHLTPSQFRFERGFVVRAAFLGSPPPSPELELLEDVRFSARHVDEALAFPLLRRARNLVAADLARLAKCPRLEEVEVNLQLTEPDLAALAAHSGKLKAARILLWTAQVAQALPLLFARPGSLAQLEHLELSSGLMAIDDIPRPTLDALPRSVTRLTVGFHSDTLVHTLTREGGRWTRLRCEANSLPDADERPLLVFADAFAADPLDSAEFSLSSHQVNDSRASTLEEWVRRRPMARALRFLRHNA